MQEIALAKRELIISNSDFFSFFFSAFQDSLSNHKMIREILRTTENRSYFLLVEGHCLEVLLSNVLEDDAFCSSYSDANGFTMKFLRHIVA